MSHEITVNVTTPPPVEVTVGPGPGPQGPPWDAWRGPWDPGVAYLRLDVVSHQGSSWTATQDTAAGEQPGVSPKWDLVAAAGQDGGAPSDATPTQVTAASQAGAAGTSANFARGDHQHPSEAFVALTTIDAKGDLLAGTGPDAVARLPVGPNGQVLTADSAAPAGLKWAAAAGGAEQGFRAHRSTNQSLAAATHTRIIFDTETRDDGANYDPVTGLYTAPATDWYDIAAGVSFDGLAAGERVIVSVYVNGVEDARAGDQTSGGTSAAWAISVSLPLYLTAGQTVGIYAWRANAGAVNGQAALTYFTGKRRV